MSFHGILIDTNWCRGPISTDPGVPHLNGPVTCVIVVLYVRAPRCVGLADYYCGFDILCTFFCARVQDPACFCLAAQPFSGFAVHLRLLPGSCLDLESVCWRPVKTASYGWSDIITLFIAVSLGVHRVRKESFVLVFGFGN